jgi:hypothetical protein
MTAAGVPMLLEVPSQLNYKKLLTILKLRVVDLLLGPCPSSSADAEEDAATPRGQWRKAHDELMAMEPELKVEDSDEPQSLLDPSQPVAVLTLPPILELKMMWWESNGPRARGLLLSTATLLAKAEQAARKDVMGSSASSSLDDPAITTDVTPATGAVRLEHLLASFTRPEVLPASDAWYCPWCKKHQEATKELALWRLPANLIVHLKRFSFRNILFRDKIGRMVEYPFDLELGLDAPAGDHAGGSYHLVAVVNHYGTLHGGHYTAMARHPGRPPLLFVCWLLLGGLYMGGGCCCP